MLADTGLLRITLKQAVDAGVTDEVDQRDRAEQRRQGGGGGGGGWCK